MEGGMRSAENSREATERAFIQKRAPGRPRGDAGTEKGRHEAMRRIRPTGRGEDDVARGPQSGGATKKPLPAVGGGA